MTEKENNLEMSLWVEFVRHSEMVETESDYIYWCSNYLKKLFPFNSMVTAIGRRYGDIVAVDEIDLIGHPESYRKDLMSDGLRISDRKALGNWLKNRSPLIIDSDSAIHLLSHSELEEFYKYKLKNIWSHGVIEPNGLSASYFSFSGDACIDNDKIQMLLKMVVPFLHQTRYAILCKRLAQQDFNHAQTNLTTREMEVLQQIISGKTNAQIAEHFQRSILTVKNQVQSILKKLTAKSRADAVRIALGKGLISIR